jgi:hypothetical protein
MIVIGAVLGGPELEDSPIGLAIDAALEAACELRKPFEIGDEPGVNVVFYVPGSITGPDWVGLRDGKFSRKRQFLMVQVAVPKEVVDSPNSQAFVIESLRAASKVAFVKFHKKGIEFALSAAEALVDPHVSQIPLVLQKHLLALPAHVFVEALGGGVVGRCRQDHAHSAGRPCHFLSARKQGLAHTTAASIGRDKQVVQNPHPPHRDRRERREQLRKANRSACDTRQKDHAVAELESCGQERTATCRIGGLLIELAIAIKERRELIEVGVAGLCDLDAIVGV